MTKNSVAVQLSLLLGDPEEDSARGHDLIGRSYFDGLSNVRVVGVCGGDIRQAIIEREADGNVWSIPASLARRLTTGDKRKRAA